MNSPKKIDLICNHSRYLYIKITLVMFIMFFSKCCAKANLLSTWTAVLRNPDAFCKSCFQPYPLWAAGKIMQRATAFLGPVGKLLPDALAQLFATTSACWAAANRLLCAMHLKKNSQFKPAFSSNARQTGQSIGHRALMASTLTETYSNNYWNNLSKVVKSPFESKAIQSTKWSQRDCHKISELSRHHGQVMEPSANPRLTLCSRLCLENRKPLRHLDDWSSQLNSKYNVY